MQNSTDRRATNARAVARRLAAQAIYRWLLNDGPWQDVLREFSDAQDMPKADREYFRVLLEGVCGGRTQMDLDLEQWTDRPAVQLDPVEHAVLLVALFELTARPELPFRVVLNEAVNLTRRYGATDGHKFVNAVLDRAARAVRSHEV